MAEEAGSRAGRAEAPRVDLSEFPPTDLAEWKDAAVAALKGAVFEKSMYTKTYEGIALEPLYTLESVKDLGVGSALPGEGDMLRGTTASEYIGRPWEVAQRAEDHDPVAAGAVIREELARGGTAISFALSSGGSSDGPCIETTDDVKAIFDGVDTAKHPSHIYCGASALPFIALAAAASHDKMRGCVGADPIGELAAHGKSPRSMAALFCEMAGAIKTASSQGCALRTILLRGAPYHDAGANAAQEVACVMSNAIACVREMSERGIGIEDVARSIRFELSIGANFFMEIAKIRAARVVWARIAEAFGGGEDARRAKIFARTSYFTKTVYDPYVNMLRNTEEAFAAVVGGVDGMTVGCFDEAIRPSDEFSRRVSRNAQIMLQEEFHFLQPADPAGGSWYIESLTHELADKIWAEIQKIEADGGILEALKKGRVQEEIASVLADRFKNLASRRDRAVGTNMYANTTEKPLAPRAIDEHKIRADREAAIAAFRSSRPSGAEAAASELAKCDCGSVAEAALKAAKAGATISEMADARGHDGIEVSPLAPHRWTEQFEALRSRTEKHRDEHGENVRIFLANLGPIPQHKARADFITGFMEVANFEVIKNDGYPTPEACADAAASSGADVAVICSTDKTYPELVPPTAKLIKAKCPKMKVCLAGAPAEEHKKSYIDAGVDDFVHVRTNCLDFLTSLQKEKGMI